MSGGRRIIGAGAVGAVKDFKSQRVTSTVTFTGSTNWANAPTYTTQTVSAAVGDVLEATLITNLDTAATAILFDVVTEVSGTPTNSFGTGGAALTGSSGDGIRAWVLASGVADRISGTAFYTVQAGDIVNNQVTVRLRYRSTTGTDRSAYGASDAGSFFHIKNLGQPGVATALSGSSVDIGYAQVTANQNTISTLVDLTGLSKAVTVPTGHRIKITGYAPFSASANGNKADLWINEGATALSRGTVTMWDTGHTGAAIVMVVLTPSAGVHTYKLQAELGGGSGSVSMKAGVTTPAFILIEDLGVASV